MGPDPLRIVEAAYRWEATDRAWLEGVISAATPFAVSGVVACLVQCTPKPHVTASAGSGVTTEQIDAVIRLCNGVDPSIAPSFFAPTEFVGNAAHRLARLAKATGRPSLELTGGVPMPPVWALVGGAYHESALVLVFPSLCGEGLAPEVPFPGENSQVLGMVGAHLSSALRLRGLTPPCPDDPLTEAVLSPDGKILDAKGDATSREMRSSLTEAVLRSERARGLIRKIDTAEATELWSALVEGTWSVLEANERDGKRFLLARRNTLRPPTLPAKPDSAPPAAKLARDLIDLTKEESDVVWLAVQGHSHKYIAYELGLSTPTVSRRLRAAMDKLRVGSRRELLRKLGIPDA